MPNDLLERPKGNEYDDDASWNRGHGSDDPNADLMSTNLDDLDSIPTASDDDLPDGHPSKSKKKKSHDNDELANAEANAGNTNRPAAASALPGEGAMAADSDTVGKGFTGTGGGGKFKAFMGKKSTKAGAFMIAGAVTGFTIFGVFGASMYMVHLRETAIGKSNRFSRLRSTSFEKRRAKSQVQKVAKASLGKAGNEAFLGSLADKLASEELSLARNEAGQILGVADNEGKLLVEFENGVPKKGFNKFLQSEAGTEFISKLDDIAPSIADEWRGIPARRNFLERLKVSLTNIFDRAPPSEDATTSERTNASLANADEIDEKANIEQQKTAEQINKENSTQGAQQTADDVLEGDLQQQADEFAAEVKTNPESAVGKLESTAEKVTGAVADDAFEAAVKDPGIFKILFAKIGTLLAKDGLQVAFKALDLAAVPQSACKLKGTINFVSHVKNVFLTVELAKFAARIMVSGDEQKAGIVKSESLKLAAIYMAGATASGGMRWMAGNTTAKVSAKSLGKYATGANPTGVFGSLSRFANKFPGTSPGTCKFVNNGLVQLGTLAVGTLVAIFGGSEIGFTESNGLTAAALTVGVEVALAIATPLLIRSVTHQVMTAVTDNISKGDGFVSGVGALAASNASANAARPITLAKKAALEREADAYARVEMAHRSIFDKYFDLNNGDSLFTKIAFASPKNLKQGILQPVSIGQNIATFFSNPINTTVAALTGGHRSAAYAAADEQCTDEYIQELGVVTDPFCNPLVADIPDLDLTRTEQALAQTSQIDGQGKPMPGSDFEKYIKNCLSGRTNLLYADSVDKDGGNNPRDTSCIEQGTPLAGDYPETIYAFRGDSNKPSLWDKITGNTKAYAAAEDETRVPGRYERFTLWYGYLIDSENLQEDITGVYSGELNATAATNTGAGALSGTATLGSFKIPDITYDKANITLPNCDFTGAQPAEAVRGEQPGAKELQKLVNDRYGQGGTGFIFNCRGMTGNPTSPSVHGTGRAVDSFFNALNPTEMQKGTDALGWLVANAQIFGIQYAKFWRVAWTPVKGFHCVTDKADQGVHSTHVHFEVNWDGALRKTPYFTGTPFAETGISVSQDLCPRL